MCEARGILPVYLAARVACLGLLLEAAPTAWRWAGLVQALAYVGALLAIAVAAERGARWEPPPALRPARLT